eukprot:CAMPEP_0172600856 /NCGR_PEP_ID=MMETSP1068-20121228/21026_1 /TAXON_ID=35684 /ORGANISM="Pseudopedinella elastica, Strain CCMP716" /LENGTH=40 /DNA_ID= /DNA_START= /DNA_END= /DNA_ORIENTATION=
MTALFAPAPAPTPNLPTLVTQSQNWGAGTSKVISLAPMMS